MRILITGATGLIGKEIGKRLAAAGHELHVTSRNPERARREIPFPAKVFKWQHYEHSFPLEALKGVEAVIHLAGEPVADGRWTEERKKRIRDSRVVGTRMLVEAIRAKPESIQSFILGSAMGYYGDRGDEICTEETSAGSDFLAKVVVDWEAEADVVRSDLESQHIRVVKIRTGIVLSRRGGALAKLIPLFSKGLGGQIGRGLQWMSWIHIVDIARLFVFATENHRIDGVFNGVAPEPVRNDRFTLLLARALGRSPGLPVPEAALKVAMGEMSSAILASTRVVSERLNQAGFEFSFPESGPAFEELGEPFKNGGHELVAEQWVPQKPEEIFPYFCDEKNLEELTPDFLGFKVMGKTTPKMQEGTLINYRIKLYGLPLKWQSRIDQWMPNKRFIDTQVSGPYKLWRHTHDFVPMAGGTLLKDRVLYKVPLGLLGDTAAGWKVTQDVSKIFSFRRQKIDSLFGSGIQQ